MASYSLLTAVDNGRFWVYVSSFLSSLSINGVCWKSEVADFINIF